MTTRLDVISTIDRLPTQQVCAQLLLRCLTLDLMANPINADGTENARPCSEFRR